MGKKKAQKGGDDKKMERGDDSHFSAAKNRHTQEEIPSKHLQVKCYKRPVEKHFFVSYFLPFFPPLS
jgi:hypothetical protein